MWQEENKMYKNKSTVTEDENTLPDINLQGKQLSDLRCSLILYLENNGYAEKTIHRYNHELDLLQVMMNEKGVIYSYFPHERWLKFL